MASLIVETAQQPYPDLVQQLGALAVAFRANFEAANARSIALVQRDDVSLSEQMAAANAAADLAPAVDAADEALRLAVALRAQRDQLLAALTGILAVANVRIDDPRCAAFDAARAAIAAATGEV